jgi:hypothetical protein
VPWLRPHQGGIASELFRDAAVEVRPVELLGKLTRMTTKELWHGGLRTTSLAAAERNPAAWWTG